MPSGRPWHVAPPARARQLLPARPANTPAPVHALSPTRRVLGVDGLRGPALSPPPPSQTAACASPHGGPAGRGRDRQRTREAPWGDHFPGPAGRAGGLPTHGLTRAPRGRHRTRHTAPGRVTEVLASEAPREGGSSRWPPPRGPPGPRVSATAQSRMRPSAGSTWGVGQVHGRQQAGHSGRPWPPQPGARRPDTQTGDAQPAAARAGVPSGHHVRLVLAPGLPHWRKHAQASGCPKFCDPVSFRSLTINTRGASHWTSCPLSLWVHRRAQSTEPRSRPCSGVPRERVLVPRGTEAPDVGQVPPSHLDHVDGY